MPPLVNHAWRRQEIAEATWQAIDDLGAAGTSMRAIADRAGCTTGRLTHYFVTRDDLLVAALQLAHERVMARLSAARGHRAERDALRAVLLAALPLDREAPVAWRVWCTLWAEAVGVEAMRHERARHDDEVRALVTDLVRGARPDAPRSTVERTAEALVAMVAGLAADLALHPSDAAARRARRVIDAQLSVLDRLDTQRRPPGAVRSG